MSLTVFPGTFNPIHIAHLIIAQTVREELNADKILFIPAFVPPHRDCDLISPNDRYNMVKLAIEDNPSFEISDIEFKRAEKSYSYLTIKELAKLNPDKKDKINFIIGSDALALIDTWHEAEKLASLVKFIVLVRPDITGIERIFNNIRLKNLDFEIVKAPLLDISSTNIRKKIIEKKSIKYLVPKPVEEYIYKNKLYMFSK